MPIIGVEIVVGPNRPQAPDLAQRLADAIGRVLCSPPGQTWVRMRSVVRTDYAENEAALADDELPVFVTVLARRSPDPCELGRDAAALTLAVAAVVERPADRVHVEFAPAAAGRLAFGGKLVD